MGASFTDMYIQFFVPYIIFMEKVANLFRKAENMCMCMLWDVLEIFLQTEMKRKMVLSLLIPAAGA